MKVTIYKRNNKSEESVYSTFDFNEELYDDKEIKFSHIMWRKLVEKKFGHEYCYIRDYYDYTNAFNRFGYKGEGIYLKGRRILGIEELEDGIRDIEIGDNLYFIV